MIQDKDIFEADYKGTCALCFGSVHPGHKLVRVRVTVCGDTYARNVHASCQQSLIDNSPADLAKLEQDAILSL